MEKCSFFGKIISSSMFLKNKKLVNFVFVSEGVWQHAIDVWFGK
jgi:hypothetical protein